MNQENSVIYNLTVKLSQQLSQEWLEKLKHSYLPHCLNRNSNIQSQINEIKIQSEDGDKTFAL